MIGQAQRRFTARARDAGEVYSVLDDLSPRDQRILGRLARRLAAIEGADGEEVALAVGQRIEMVLRGGAPA